MNVNPVLVEKVNAVPVELNVTVLLPKLIVRTLLLLDARDGEVTLKLLVVNVPAFNPIVAEQVKASPNATVGENDAPPMLKVFIVLPAVINVALALALFHTKAPE